jgi:hypothetical protein
LKKALYEKVSFLNHTL